MLSNPDKLLEYRHQMENAIVHEDYEAAAAYASRLSNGRAAAVLQSFDEERTIKCLLNMKPQNAGAVMGHFPPEAGARLLNAMEKQSALKMVTNIKEDRLADMLTILDEDLSEEFLQQLKEEDREVTRKLMHYEPGSVGAAMAGYYIAVEKGTSVDEVLEAVRESPPKIENRSYVYVLNGDEQLTGVVSLKELLRFPGNQKVENVMVSPVIAVNAKDDAVKAAETMRNRMLKMLPVLDENGKMVGILDLDDALEITTQSVADQMAMVGGGSPDESFYTPPLGSVQKRLPWMAANVFLNLGAVAVISSFEATIEAVAILAAFLPMITDMGGNVGIQALSVSIRSIALGEVRISDYWKSTQKEVVVGLINGVALGILFAAIAYVLQGNLVLGLVAGIALGLNVLIAGIVGGSLPFLIKKIGKDPAMMTGPVLTTITDITGVSVYLGLSTVFLMHILG